MVNLTNILIVFLLIITTIGVIIAVLKSITDKQIVVVENLQIKNSVINGEGVFATIDYEPNDIIVKDIFPSAPVGFEKSIRHSGDFSKYINEFGAKINHCSISFNSDLIKDDNTGEYQLFAVRKINKGDEITSNYDIVNDKYPKLIASSDPNYSSC